MIYSISSQFLSSFVAQIQTKDLRIFGKIWGEHKPSSIYSQTHGLSPNIFESNGRG